MLLLAIVISLVNAFVLAMYGVKKYRLSLTASFFVNSLVALIWADSVFGSHWLSSKWVWFFVLGLTVALLLFSKLATYFLAWIIFTGTLGWPFKSMGLLDGGAAVSGIISLVAITVGIVVVYKTRAHLIKVMVGILSGGSASFAVLILLSYVISAETMKTMKYLPFIICLLGLVAGIVFQYKMLPRLNKETPVA